jgi:hypothetical protein
MGFHSRLSAARVAIVYSALSLFSSLALLAAVNASSPQDVIGTFSTRAYVGRADDVLLSGFIVTGSEPKEFLSAGWADRSP